MTIEEQVSKGIMAAMKAKDTIRLEVLRNIKKVFIEAKSVAGAPEQIADSRIRLYSLLAALNSGISNQSNSYNHLTYEMRSRILRFNQSALILIYLI